MLCPARMLVVVASLIFAQSRPRLVDTIIAVDPRDSFAVVTVDSEYRALKNGDRVAEVDDTTVVAIEPARVVLSRGGERRWLVKEPRSCPSLRELEGIGCAPRGERIVPAFRDGRPIGFKMFSVRPDSVYARFGLKNGDLVMRINGWDVTSPDRALQIYDRLRRATSLSVELERSGELISIGCALPGLHLGHSTEKR
jgi:type II secretory pathway component PulC